MDVAITGLGIILPGVPHLDAFATLLHAGNSTVRRLPPELGARSARIGGHMLDFNLAAHLTAAPYDIDTERLTRFLRNSTVTTSTVVLSALQAARDSGLGPALLTDPETASLCAAQDVGLRYMHDNVRQFNAHPDDIQIMYGIHHMDEDGLGAINQVLGITGPSYSVGAACATGNVALQNAFDLIRAGHVRRALVSAVAMDNDACGYDSISEMGGTVPDAPDPTAASRPFDRDRQGFVLAQGAASLMLERGDDALARGATIHGWMQGAALRSNARHTTHPDLLTQTTVMNEALQDAGLGIAEIDYVSAHATGTPLGDQTEAQTIQSVFGARTAEIWVNATKSLIGHTTTAAALIQAIAVLVQMKEGWLHPTRNLQHPDVDLRLTDPNTAVPYRPKRALSNAFGYGGFSSSVVLCSPALHPRRI